MTIAETLLPEFDLEMATSRRVHHRGQLTVYLRLVDVPVPSIYVPTADEPMPGF